MTDMTDETEAVALAVAQQVVGPDFDPFANPEAFSFWCQLAQAAITALDKHRIERAGEVEQNLIASTAQRSFGGDHCFASVALMQEAAATIAALKAQIERLTEREAQIELDGVRKGIEAAVNRIELSAIVYTAVQSDPSVAQNSNALAKLREAEIALDKAASDVRALDAKAIAKGEG